jgi:hypothetical protein
MRNFEVGSWKAEGGILKSEVGMRKSEKKEGEKVRQNSEVGMRKSEKKEDEKVGRLDRRRKLECGRWKFEFGIRKSEGGRWKDRAKRVGHRA